METGKKRIEWLDALKGFAIIAVVLGHAFVGYGYNQTFPRWNGMIEYLKNWIYLWHMPLFMLLSGYAFEMSTKQEDGTYAKYKVHKNMLNFVLLYLLFQSILGMLKILFSSFVDVPMQWSILLPEIMFPNTVLWYLWVLVIYYGIFPIFSKYIKSEILIAILFVGSIAICKLGESINVGLCVKNLFYCAPFFYSGMRLYYPSSSLQIYNNRRNWTIYGALLIVFSVIYQRMFYEKVLVEIRAICELVAAYIVIGLLIKLFQKEAVICKTGLLQRLGQASLVIYLLHTYIVTAIKVFVTRMGFQGILFWIPVTVVVAIAIPYVIFVLSKKIKIIQYIFKPILLLDDMRKK